MKLVAIIIALVIFQASAAPTDTDLGSAVAKFLTKLQQSLPCGLGDGKSLSPYIMSKDNDKNQKIEYNSPDLQLKIKIKDFQMTGLNTFEILSSTYNKDTKEYKIDFKTPKSHLKASYEIDHKLNITYLGMKWSSEGSIELDVQEAHVVANMTFAHDSEGNLMVKAMNITEPDEANKQKFNYGDELDEAFGEFSEIISEIEKELDETVIEMVQPKLNEILRKYKSVDELTAEIVKMTGDDNTGLFGKGTPCNQI